MSAAGRPGNTTGALYYLHQDHFGSLSAVTNLSGSVISRQWYHPYGSVRVSTGALPTDITFTGQRSDATGLYFYNARYYSPLSGRFISADSIVPEPGNPQALNRYSYVLNNPIKYRDPSGHWVETAWDIISIGLTLNDIREEGLTWQNGLALAVDVTTAILPGVPAFAGVLMKGGKAVARADDVLDLVRGVQWAERFAGAGPEVMHGIRYLEKMANSPNVWGPFRRGYAAELLRAEQLHKAGKLKGVEVMIEGGRVDFVLITDELVEFKYWTQSYTDKNIGELAKQLTKYQRSGQPLILELARTRTNPITEAYIEQLLEKLQAEGVRITREQIRLIDLP